MKKIAIIGSTGSIGTQTLEVVRHNPDFSVEALSCGRNIDLLEEQIREFKPRLAAVESEEDAKELKSRLRDINITIASGMEGLVAVAGCEYVDTVVTAIVGMIGVRPTLAAIKAGKNIALANKETLVTAGHLVMKRAAEKNVKILPVDSEHSAIFQSLQGNEENKIRRILLTASGGPFRGRTRDELRDVTVQQALNHPNWSMGPKITIDSATMVNKGLEIIEAHWLFDVSADMIEVVVQPESIIHSAVEYEDGAVMAQLGVPDMKLPIQYALTYPERRPMQGDRLDFTKLSGINLSVPDRNTFKGLDFDSRASSVGGSMPTVLNAANEFAVAKFLKGECKFLDIYDIIEYAMDMHEGKVTEHPSLDDILDTEKWTDEILFSKFGE